MDVSSLDCDFVSVDYHLSQAGVDACANCLHLFTHGDVQQFDIGTGHYTGDFPIGWTAPQQWLERVCLALPSTDQLLTYLCTAWSTSVPQMPKTYQR